MQQISDTPSSSMSCVSNEILSMILHYTMRSDMPVHLEHFVQLGRRYQDIRKKEKDTQTPGADFREIESRFSESSIGSACSERWFLDQLDPGQVEHFRDWLLINSTCRGFRAWGKKAFFSEKIFVIRPLFLERPFSSYTRIMSAEDKTTAQAYIRHVIAPLSYTKTGIYASQIDTLPRYRALHRNLRSISLQFDCAEHEFLSRLNGPALKRHPFPKELRSLLWDHGLLTSDTRLKLEIQDDKEPGELIKFLTTWVYPELRGRLSLTKSWPERRGQAS